MIIVTGSIGLIGSTTCHFFLKKKIKVIGIDNDIRKYFFGEKASNKWKKNILKKDKNYLHINLDIRNKVKLFKVFKKYKNKIKSIIHTAAQPSHDWASKEPLTDFNINANGTINLLEAIKRVKSVKSSRARRRRAKNSEGSLRHVAIVGPPQVRMPLAPLLVQVAAHDRRMEPPAQPRLVARLALAAGLQLHLELTHLHGNQVLGEAAIAAPLKEAGCEARRTQCRPAGRLRERQIRI